MSSISTPTRNAESPARVSLAPLGDTSTFAERAYRALRDVIVSLDVYGQPGEIRLDERRLAQDLGISRTRVREAMAQLEREGFVRSIPRRGVYVVRKTKREVIEMITAWAALESMAARLITLNAADEEIARLHAMFTTFENGQLHAKLDEYSEVNIQFHQAIIAMMAWWNWMLTSEYSSSLAWSWPFSKVVNMACSLAISSSAALSVISRAAMLSSAAQAVIISMTSRLVLRTT